MTSTGLSLPDQNPAVAFDYGRNNFHYFCFFFRCHFPSFAYSAIIGIRMHSERLLGYFRNPVHAGELGPPAVRVDVTNPACGDMLRLTALFAGDIVEEARFLTRGCTAAIAASEALAEWMTGKSRREMEMMTVSVIEEAVGGLEPASKHVAVLCVDAIRSLLRAEAVVRDS